MGGILNNVDPYRNKETIIPTVLKVTSEEIEYWSHMTCFYDKYWSFDPKLSTVPVSFMHITSITETILAQGAEKRVILYEAPETAQTAAGFTNFIPKSHSAKKNNLEVIMDNIVVQPKQYQMEVIVPDSLIGPYHVQGLRRLEALMDHLTMTEDSTKNITKGMAKILNITQAMGDAIDTVTDLLGLIISNGFGSTQIETLNKNSLEAMASKGRVVLFKKWMGYDYSYGVITKVDLAKKPSEEGVFRGSITFQETPILNISPEDMDKAVKTSWKDSVVITASQAARVLNLTLALPFLKMTGVMDEAGAPGSDTPDGGDFFDIYQLK